MRLALRVVVGVSLLALVIWYARPAQLWAKLREADLALFLCALSIGIASNIVSAIRWAAIARGFGLKAPTVALIAMYARGMTTNMLLPGATLSGDLLRSVQLSRLGNSFMASALSVFLDRFSGLWTLCVLSLLAAVGALFRNDIDHWALGWYVLALAALIGAPFVPLPLERLRDSATSLLSRAAAGWERLQARLRQARPALIASIWQSLVVQFLSAAALWICGKSVGVSLPYLVMLSASAPIFIMAALPIGVAGFGTRELAAAVVLGAIGVPGDRATATAMLYGLNAIIQGVLAAPLFLSNPSAKTR